MLRSLAVCLLALTAYTEPAPAAVIDPADLAISHQSFVLDNGLRVVVHEDHSVPLVAVNLYYHVGSRNERRGRTGFAHLFEHFFFNGSEHYPHGFREAMDDLGANNRNGTTNGDRTNFFEDVPTSALERTLYLEADRMGYLAGNLSPDMLERERGVVQNEKRQGENQPYGRVFNRILESLYPYSHPYNWPTIGSMADLNAATLDDIREWYATWYGPNNAVLALAGDITVADAKLLVGKYFGGIPPGAPVARLESWVPTLDADIRDTLQDRVPQARIYRAWLAPPMGQRELHALQLYSGVLAGSGSSLLTRKLVYEAGLATDVDAFVADAELASTFVIAVSVKPGVDPADAETALDAAIAASLKSAPPGKALSGARMRYLTQFARGMERLGGFGGRADVLADSWTHLGRADAYLDRLRDYQRIPGESIAEIARLWLGKHHYTLTVQPYPKLRASASELDRTQLPALGAPADVSLPAMQRFELANGMKVVLLERHSAPLVQMALTVDAGIAADAADARGTGRLAMELLLKGTRTRDAFAIADEADALGASFGIEHTQDQSLLTLSALKPNLAASIGLYADVARRPAFAPDMVDLQRKQQLATIQQQLANPGSAAQRAAAPLLYGAEHPYAQAAGGFGDRDVVAAISSQALADWHARWFVPANTTLVVAGDVTMAELQPLLAGSFGDWTGPQPPTKVPTPASFVGRGKLYLIDKPEAPQSLILAAHVTDAGPRGDDLALETVMRNFGGMATSRLNRNLRLDKHWSYGSFGGINNARGPRLFSVIAPVQTDRTSDAMREIRAEIDGLAGTRPLAGAELDSALRGQLARLPGRFETLNALLGAGLEVASLGREPDYYSHYAANVRALNGEQLNAAAAAVVQPEQLMWLVVGDLSKIEASIRALGWGDVVQIDAR